MPIHRAGARSGLWPVISDRLSPGSTVYSFGVGDNIAWELELIARFRVTVHAFDPTPGSVAWIAGQQLPDAFEFHPIGLGTHDGRARFRLPEAGRFNYVPHHEGLDMPAGSTVECPVRTLETLMNDRGHARIDVLKLDIEGGEYAVLEEVIAVRPDQLLIEFHHNMPTIGFERTLAALEGLRAAGYRVFDISRRGLEIGFVRS